MMKKKYRILELKRWSNSSVKDVYYWILQEERTSFFHPKTLKWHSVTEWYMDGKERVYYYKLEDAKKAAKHYDCEIIKEEEA